MLLRAIQFTLITFGITMMVAFMVAALVKLIGVVAQRGQKANEAIKPKE